jgi:hypothetical protein
LYGAAKSRNSGLFPARRIALRHCTEARAIEHGVQNDLHCPESDSVCGANTCLQLERALPHRSFLADGFLGKSLISS